jgi:hypothetical protein
MYCPVSMAQGKVEEFFLGFGHQKDLLSCNSSSISLQGKGFAKSTLARVDSADLGNFSVGFPTIFGVQGSCIN